MDSNTSDSDAFSGFRVACVLAEEASDPRLGP